MKIIKKFNSIILFIRFDFIWKIKDFFAEWLVNKRITIYHKNIKLQFEAPNRLTKYRALTFSEKEPFTLRWIEQFADGQIFWDIGANIGLYSIYASKVKKLSTFAIEPSVFNLDLLAKNIILNNLEDSISIIPLAINSTSGSSFLNMSSVERGGALSSFDHAIDQYGKNMVPSFKYATLGVSGNDLLNFFQIPQPDHIKIDVDGIEHIILLGLGDVIKNTKSILIEIDENNLHQLNQSESLLIEAGFKLDRKDPINKNNKQFNQIWIRGA
jgi:FkbM family methyltransferase